MSSIDEAAENYLKGCVRAYLHGKNSIDWILGIVRGSSLRQIKEVVDSVENPVPSLKEELLRRI